MPGDKSKDLPRVFLPATVSGFADSEKIFINDVICQNAPLLSNWKPERLPEHLGIIRIGTDFVDVAGGEIEKCFDGDELPF